MDDSYLYTPPDPSVGKGIKWLLALLVLRVQKPVQLAAFFSLNPMLRDHLTSWLRARTKSKDQATVARRAHKLANLVSVGFLYSAVSGNANIPKDYLLIYIYMKYYGTLNPPSSKIRVSPTMSKWCKVDHYNEHVRRLYAHKHLVIFPLIFGQILSNYLTPTRRKLNQRYLLSSIKTRILDPVWINFHMGVKSQSVNWLGLVKSYAKHNLWLAAFFAVKVAKSRLVDHYYELKHGVYQGAGGAKGIVKNYLVYVFHKANVMANFIYGPNLLSMLLIALTAPLLTRVAPVRAFYMANLKQFVKNYVKGIGFVAAFAALSLNNIDLIPSIGYTPLKQEPNVRTISTSFLDDLNIYLFRLIVLSKWRITKENHPWFTVLNLGSWQRLESVVMCYGVWKLMNLNDYIKRNRYSGDHKECARLEGESLIKAIDRIMT